MATQLAGCVIKDEAGKVLLIHRNTERLVQWELPGGKVEPGESLQAAAIREVEEEVGLQVSLEREIGVASFDDNGVTWEYHWFEATIVAGKVAIGEPDRFDGAEYFDIFDMDADQVSINILNLRRAVKEEGAIL
jgi:8-oxo-dGTP pyrophosphatase MutT (NUDIX family)